MPFQRVLLINNNNLEPPVAPVALDYLGASLEANGIEPVLADLVWAENTYDYLAETIDRKGPFCLAAVTVRNIDDSSSQTKKFYLPQLKKLAAWLKEEYNLPVVLGGCGFSIMPGEVLQFCGADYGIWGDGEDALPELAIKLGSGKDTSTIPGLLVNRDGHVSFNTPRYISLPDKEWLSKRSLVDNYLYFVKGGQGNLETKRGCDRQCIYCADPQGRGEIQRLRPPRHIVQELQNLLAQGINCFHLCDSEFNLPPEHAKDICSALIESGLNQKMSWYAYLSPVPFTEELASLIKKAGCAGINFGVDSANEKMLSFLRREHDRASLKKMAELCQRYAIPFMADLLLGGPGETKKTIEESIVFMKELDPLAVGISLGVRLYKYTPLGKKIRQEGLNAWAGCLQGEVDDNEDFLRPVYYLSPALGEDIQEYLMELTCDDPRFFSLGDPRKERDYGYTENLVLMDAIAQGYRGAYWHILQKLQDIG